MKKKVSFLYCLAACTLGVGPVSAQPLTVYLTGHVQYVDDSGGVLGGQLTVGQAVTGQYTYDTSVPDQNPDYRYGSYNEGYWQSGIQVSAGSLVFQTDSTIPYSNFHIDAHPSDWPAAHYEGYVRLSSGVNKPLANGAFVNQIGVELNDFSGNFPANDALPASAPNVQQISEKMIVIQGGSGSSTFYARIDIDSASSVAPPDGGWTVSPPTGTFSRQQRFDAALLLPPGSQVQSMQAIVNGGPLGIFSLPGYCFLTPPNTQGSPVILCPDASNRLMDGTSHIEWNVVLMNGTVLSKSVDWQLIP